MKRYKAPPRPDFFYMNQEFIHFGLSTNAHNTAIELLKQQLVDALDLGLQAKQARWNVKAHRFLTLQELFVRVARVADEFVDLLAERAVQIGGVVEGTAHVIVRDSRLPVYALDIRQAGEHVRALTTALGRFAASARLGAGAATAAGDTSTAELFAQISQSADLLLWKAGAHAYDQQASAATMVRAV